MTPEKAYEILDKKYPIPYTDWNDPKDVERRQKEIEMEFRNDLKTAFKISNADFKSAVDNNYCIIKDNCAFEKLYAKYTGRSEIAITEKEYCRVFNMTYATDKELNQYYLYKWFNRVMN